MPDNVFDERVREMTVRRRRGKESLMPVAIRHFSRYGDEGTSLRRIAAEAEVDMALIARLFGGADRRDHFSAHRHIIITGITTDLLAIQNISTSLRIRHEAIKNLHTEK